MSITRIKPICLFYLFICLTLMFPKLSAAQSDDYTFETIDVEGVDFLSLTASSDFEDYAGYTKSPDGEKEIAFTLIDGVFSTHDYPGSQNTYFYALGNDGTAAGYYEDSDGLHHGVILENGEWRQYNFPGSVQTEIFGISDSTGALTGNFIDTEGVRRGFTGDEIIEFPGASATYADFVSAGRLVGSYIDADGIYHAYIRFSDGFTSIDLPGAANIDYYFVHGINDAGTYIERSQVVGDMPRTHVATYAGREELRVPGSVSTEGYNINQDGSIVGNYETADGRRHGFIARPAVEASTITNIAGDDWTYESIDVPGVDFLALTASSDFEDYAGYTKSADGSKDIAFTLIDGVFTTYDFPGSQNTYFYALGNDGRAAGHYQDSDGLHHGVILESGELQQYDFPGAIETFIYGISDATGVLTGSFIDAEGVRRGFSGDITIEYPGAVATYADFVNATGDIVGSYIDAEGVYHAYTRFPDGSIRSVDFPLSLSLEYFFVHGINDAGITVTRVKLVGDIPRTYVATLQGSYPLQFPGSVSTHGWNINQDSSVVGYYDTDDGRRHGFIARPASAEEPAVEPVVAPASDDYTFESIDVPGVDFLAVAASSDFGDYAGYTRSADGEKDIAFTLIDGVFTTYDFPDSQNTYFYALGNNGNAAGHYEDSDGLFHGIVLENGELRQYNFPNSVETEIYGISDATGALTGNFTDAEGIRRGFTGDEIIEFPGASETFADFVSAGRLVGSYIDASGIYHAYIRSPQGDYASIELPDGPNLAYYFVPGINDAGTYVARAKYVDDIPRTYVGTFTGREELQVPGSVSTSGYNINQDGSVVGHYESADGRTHGFIARPAADPDAQPVVTPTDFTYIFDTIDVPGVDFLALTASSDFEDYAGYTKSPDGEKDVAFTLIDGVFTTYDFPGSQNTYFYAFGNDGRAAGYYEDSDGLHHGVILENGELRQYNFANAVQTEIFGISDATGALTGNFIDASGVRRGFSGEAIVEFPGALETYADFVSASRIVGSYIDAEGVYHPYIRDANGSMRSIDLPLGANIEYLFSHGINDAQVTVNRLKLVDDIPRTYVGSFLLGLHELRVPGSVSTHGWNINQDSSVVGYYNSPDGRRHGFVARPASQMEAESYSNAYTVTLSKGLNMLSVPLAPSAPMTAKSLAGMAGATTVITLDAANQQFVAWTPGAPDDGFAIEGGQGYIVNVPQPRNFAFVGAPWTDPIEDAAAAPAITKGVVTQEAWAFVVSGNLVGKPAYDGYQVSVRNLRTNRTLTASVQGDYFAAATADLTRKSVVQVGDIVEVRVLGPDGNFESQIHSFEVTPDHLANAVLSVNLDGIGQPNQNLLLQNYPNPFNPETWIPYQLSEDTSVSVSIYDTTGRLVRTLSLGFQAAGFYNSRSRAAYWDGRNELGERVASGVYFYQLTTPDFQQTRRLVILK